MKTSYLSTLVLVLSAVFASRGTAQDDFCLECHGSQTEMAGFVDGDAAAAALTVDGPLFARSVHSLMSCTDCHVDGYEEPPHGSDTTTISCSECHDDVAAVLSASVHGSTAADGSGRTPPTCTSCHGTHDVLPPSDRQSHLNPLNVYQVCGKCHFEKDPATSTVAELLREPYTDDSHARGILTAGLTVSATCVSCHGGHDIHAKGDPASPVSRSHVAETCGTCHVGVLEQYRQSIHNLVSVGDEHKGATCSDCHAPHSMQQADDKFRVQSIKACTNCHAERAGSFRLSYHGKVTNLGFEGRIATCESCHGNHRILPASDPASTINPANIVSTCAQCHEGAHTEFTNYLVHADPTDGAKYPELNLIWISMNALFIGTLILGCLHALLWLIRGLAAGDHRRPPASERGGYVRRWPLSYVVFHVWMMVSVLLLASTGLPLHFADKHWALTLMGFFGGPVAAGLVHRYAAVALVLLFASFFTSVLWRLLVKREKGMFFGPDSMVPRIQDLKDLWATLRWFLFLAPRPRYDRWTYWEKFDFWAATWGLFVIGISGLMLWFPVEATHFVPGWFLNAAVIIHGIEALLDIAFIFTVHVFHANLRPDKFPMDTAFLTGRITEAEFRHERPLEFERLAAAGTLSSIAADPPTRRTRVAAYVLGGCSLALGIFFVVMMILAVVQG
ncbi:MAG: cytochrome c3 family protein [Planctomycetes bacterium]|nr:cytochrome c3 family protein [Planctomycetota bacterium]